SPDVTGDTKGRGMQMTMTVAKGNVGSRMEATNGRLDSGKFAVGKKGRDVRELGLRGHRGYFDGDQFLRIQVRGNHIHRVSVVTRIDACDAFELLIVEIGRAHV